MKVILSLAASSDGYIDDCRPAPLRLSSDEDWCAVMELRAACDVILVGAGTLRADNPSLRIKDEGLRNRRVAAGMNPDIVRAVVSRDGTLDARLRFFDEDGASRIVLHGDLTARGILSTLVEKGFRRLMVEGGSQIARMFLDEGMADELRLAVAPVEVGNPSAPVMPYFKELLSGSFNGMTLDGKELLGDTQVYHFKNSGDRGLLRRAIGISRNSTPELTSYRVGAVIKTVTGELFEGYTHQTCARNHAEEEAITAALATGAQLAGAVIYTSMEPCTQRRSKERSCSQLIIDHRFARCVFALHEPPCLADCRGAEMLREAGIEVEIMKDMGGEVAEINSHICSQV